LSSRHLFDRFPSLVGRVPFVELGTFPTPLETLDALAEEMGLASLLVKRDDVSGEPYGGNKVRKLEFLLGDALAAGATETLTFGAAGSNHALATAVYAARLGMKPYSMLSGQPNAAYVRRNLLAGHAVGAELLLAPDLEGREREAVRLLQERERATGRRPYVVPMGGTSPLGTLGPVEGGLELGAQVAEAGLPAPDVLYVALGSMGTAAGVIVGLAALGLPTRIVAVRVTPSEWANAGKLTGLIDSTVALLRENGAEVPDVDARSWRVHDEAFGEGYARFTAEGVAACACAEDAGLHLEGTYTGKTFGAMLADARAGELRGKRVAFWNTYNSRDVTSLIGDVSPEDLPEPFRRYFSEPLQPLDPAS
jgi:D-cysteine desulfhydrase